MSEPLLIALRESLQASLLLALALFSRPARDDAGCRRSLLAGFLSGLLLGCAAGAVPLLSAGLGTHETWTFWRHAAESAVFYGSVALLAARREPPRAALVPGLFLLGFLLCFFESRTLAFIVHDLGAASGRSAASFGAAAGGIILGFLPLALLRNQVRGLPFERTFTPASLLMTIGALQFGFGGLGELGGESVMVPLQRGLQLFVNEFVKSVQSALLITDHPFLDVTLSGLTQYLGSDRSALTLTVLFLMVPPVFLLIVLFARPDPVVSGIPGSSRRRQNVAAFRQDLTLQTAPVLTSFLVLVVLLHAVNVSLNPLYDPEPVPVREAEGSDSIRIPLSGKTGDLGDKKLRKYVYYQGSKQVLFLAVMKADGTVGVALDQCEICRPADWNKDAKGYAQQGENLFCKYCVTPITTNTVNTPGGCNPIPVPFTLAENTIVISRDELVRIFDKAEALERKGTHL
jgi:hypothetical protein